MVVAVQDGADWLQGVVQNHRADAIRILDFPHAAQRVAAIGEQLLLLGQSLLADWLEIRLHHLKHEGADAVLPDLHRFSEQVGSPEAIEEHLRYLCKRVTQWLPTNVNPLLAYGCPLQAIVHAFGFDERTVATWQRRAGTHCKRVHSDVMQQGKVMSQHLQANEIRAKGQEGHCVDRLSDGCHDALMARRDGEPASRSCVP